MLYSIEFYYDNTNCKSGKYKFDYDARITRRIGFGFRVWRVGVAFVKDVYLYKKIGK